ncbi:signal transduction histidine kinase [Limtongia smithiae]|uniref:signal transduction histidine kinase n=1 Tax=Limtongia smithiae TaxID=1125753 RepID=UPI0034CF64C9
MSAPAAAPAAPPSAAPATGHAPPVASPDIVDWTTFGQILEMDDDEDDREFSQGIVWNFFEQAETTFNQMDAALEDKDLDQLSSLGHFLKGSSAALGLTRVKDSCEMIQHLGAGKDQTGTTDVTDQEYLLTTIGSIIKQARQDYAESETFLRQFYAEPE